MKHGKSSLIDTENSTFRKGSDKSGRETYITEHSKGAIKGQLTLDDCGMSMNPEEVEEENPVTAEELGCDPETGEVIEKQPEQKTEHKVISLKAVND